MNSLFSNIIGGKVGDFIGIKFVSQSSGFTVKKKDMSYLKSINPNDYKDTHTTFNLKTYSDEAFFFGANSTVELDIAPSHIHTGGKFISCNLPSIKQNFGVFKK